jgi:hypothetical protein
LAFADGMPFKPAELGWQRDNVRYARIWQDDALQMLVVPCCHWFVVVQFDAGNADVRLAGAKAEITGQLVLPSAADPFDCAQFSVAVVPEFAAAPAQGLAPLLMDMPGRPGPAMPFPVRSDGPEPGRHVGLTLPRPRLHRLASQLTGCKKKLYRAVQSPRSSLSRRRPPPTAPPYFKAPSSSPRQRTSYRLPTIQTGCPHLRRGATPGH